MSIDFESPKDADARPEAEKRTRSPLRKALDPAAVLGEFAKTRMVSFRLTPEEYDRYRELCLAHGHPSVSEMARTALHSLLDHPAALSAQSLDARLAELENRVRVLMTEMRKLLSRPEHVESGP